MKKLLLIQLCPLAGLAQTAPAPTPSFASVTPLTHPRPANGDGAVKIPGDLKHWHEVTLGVDWRN
ncbi:MAG: hypothetical protein ABIZ04_16080 [Opitutus sp.]